MALERKVGKVANRLLTTRGSDITCAPIAANDLRDFEVEQVRSLRSVPAGKHSGHYRISLLELEKQGDNR
jgi:hypothetical protein